MTARALTETAARPLADLQDWTPCPAPGRVPLDGKHCRLLPLTPDRVAGLFSAIGGTANDALWTYIPTGPFENAEGLAAMLEAAHQKLGWRTMVIEDQDGVIQGMASYMRIREAHGSAEVGCIVFGPGLQRTKAATEAMYLMARHLFDDLGYRRYEWKCDAMNKASNRAALRFGFSHEGVFRNDLVVKGRNRDTVWYSMIDSEWPAIDQAFRQWLDDRNFDAEGRQIKCLAEFREGSR